jgi:DNA-binding PadR family transcriptional regulator
MISGPSYGYAVVKQSNSNYSPAAVYKAISVLMQLGLVEPLDPPEKTTRLRKWYRITARGASAHREMFERSWWQRLLSRPETVTHDTLVAALDEYEDYVRAQLGSEVSEHKGVIAELVELEQRIVNNARLAWVKLAKSLISEVYDG